MRAIQETTIIKANGEIVSMGYGKVTLPMLQGWVGGYIEAVPRHPIPNATVYVNEEGMMMGLRHNPVASAMMGQNLVGDVVIVDDSNT